MAESRVADVEFKKIRERYVPDADIVCRFEYVRSELKAGDVVAIKKIGWAEDELHESLVAVSAADAEVDTPASNTKRITFPRARFAGLAAWPDEELFQFCYISGSKLSGVSTSFTIIRPKESDYADLSRADSDVNDDDGFVVLRSPQALFQEKLEELQTELSTAEATKESIEKENKVLYGKLDSLQEALVQLKQERSAVQLEREALALETERARLREQKLEDTLESAIANHADKEKRMIGVLENEKRRGRDMERALQEVSDELTKVRAENAEVRKALEDMHRKRREDEKLCDANDVMMKGLKEEVQSLELQISHAAADRDLAAKTLQTMQQALEREKELRKQDHNQVAELKNSLEKAKRTVDELTLRLEKGADEYAKLGSKLEKLREKYDQKMNQIRSVTKVKEVATSTPPARDPEPTLPVADKASLACEDCGKDVFANVTPAEQKSDQFFCSVCARVFARGVLGANHRFHCHVESHFPAKTDARAPDQRSTSLVAESQDTCTHCGKQEAGHGQHVCPICARAFCKKIPGIDSYFHCHVESHFDPYRNTTKP